MRPHRDARNVNRSGAADERLHDRCTELLLEQLLARL